MNFLAHSVLAFGDASLLAGQFAGDFVRGTDLSGFPPLVAAGIRLHRRVDAFTDAHPAVLAARASFEPGTRRHAGIVIDVVFDHLLARDWPAPAGRDLAAHAAWVDSALSVHEDVLPASLGRFAAFMARERVLEGNADSVQVARTLARLSRRSPRMAPLALAATPARVEALAGRLDGAFAALWPALETMARRRADEARDAARNGAAAGRPGERGG